MVKRWYQFMKESKNDDLLEIVDHLTLICNQTPDLYPIDYINHSIIYYFYGTELDIDQIIRVNNQIEYLGYIVLQNFHLQSGHFIQIGKLGEYQSINDLPINKENKITIQKKFEVGKKWISFVYKNEWISVEEIFSDRMEDPVRFYPDNELSGLSLETWMNIYLYDFQSGILGW